MGCDKGRGQRLHGLAAHRSGRGREPPVGAPLSLPRPVPPQRFAPTALGRRGWQHCETVGAHSPRRLRYGARSDRRGSSLVTRFSRTRGDQVQGRPRVGTSPGSPRTRGISPRREADRRKRRMTPPMPVSAWSSSPSLTGSSAATASASSWRNSSRSSAELVIGRPVGRSAAIPVRLDSTIASTCSATGRSPRCATSASGATVATIEVTMATGSSIVGHASTMRAVSSTW